MEKLESSNQNHQLETTGDDRPPSLTNLPASGITLLVPLCSLDSDLCNGVGGCREIMWRLVVVGQKSLIKTLSAHYYITPQYFLTPSAPLHRLTTNKRNDVGGVKPLIAGGWWLTTDDKIWLAGLLTEFQLFKTFLFKKY